MFREERTHKPCPAAQGPGEDNLLTYVFIAYKLPRPNMEKTGIIFGIFLIINQNYNNVLSEYA